MLEAIQNSINNFFSECGVWIMGVFSWSVCIFSIVLFCIYATTKSRKPLNIMGTLLVIWIFLKGMSGV